MELNVVHERQGFLAFILTQLDEMTSDNLSWYVCHFLYELVYTFTLFFKPESTESHNLYVLVYHRI